VYHLKIRRRAELSRAIPWPAHGPPCQLSGIFSSVAGSAAFERLEEVNNLKLRKLKMERRKLELEVEKGKLKGKVGKYEESIRAEKGKLEVEKGKLEVLKGKVRAEKAEKMFFINLYENAISERLAVTRALHSRGVMGDLAHPYLHLT
jgi:hypothetical protein